MGIKTVLANVVTSLTLEKVVRFAARRTADVVYYSIPVFTDPKLGAAILVTHRVTKIVATKYKRINFDPQVIFEDSIDAITDAY